jgi:hypothetical protein
MIIQGQRFSSSHTLRWFGGLACGIRFIYLLGLFSAAATASDATIHQQDVQVGATGPLAPGQAAAPPFLTYYVDGQGGDDRNPGTAPEEAWRSIARTNRADFAPGDPTNLSNHSGNGIVAGGVDGGRAEYCEAFNNGLTNHFGGIYFWAGGRGISDAQVYKNVIINAHHAIRSTHDIPGPVFCNNILIAEKAVIAGPLREAVFESKPPFTS